MGTVPFDPRVAELVTITKIKPGDRVALYHGHGDHKTVSPANQSVLAYTFNEVFEIEQSGARLPVLVFEDGSRSRPHGVYARHF